MANPSARVPLDSLVDLACRDGVDVRPTLLRVLTDLYVQRPNHSGEEETQYIELVLGLIDSVDAQTRATVAAKLRAYENAPAAIFTKLARIGQDRRDLEADSELIDLFFSAAPEERRLILINLDVTIDSSSRRRPVPAAGELVRRLEGAALKRSPAEFSRILERALSVSQKLARRITYDQSGEPLVVAAKALGMSVDALQRILLFLNPEISQSVNRLYELSSLFAELNAAAAGRMLSIWQAGAVRQHRHEPAYWNDERHSIRAVNPPSSRPVAGREIPPNRHKINQR